MLTVDALEGCVYRVTTDSIMRSVKDMLGWRQSSSHQVQLTVSLSLLVLMAL